MARIFPVEFPTTTVFAEESSDVLHILAFIKGKVNDNLEERYPIRYKRVIRW